MGSQIDPITASKLKEAVECDLRGDIHDAIKLYTEGITSLMIIMRAASDKPEFCKKVKDNIDNYLKRAETLKNTIKTKKHFHIEINDDAVGFGYETVFKEHLNNDVKFVEINDPYIRTTHQVQNLVRFIETLIKFTKCTHIKLTTTKCTCQNEIDKQDKNLSKVIENCQIYFNLDLAVVYSTTLHDRSIKFNTGLTIKIGRGLDYFKPQNYLCPGTFDLDLRKCHQTSIDIYWN